MKTKEQGHEKNVTNFELLAEQCIGMNGRYNPSRVALQTASLTVLLKSAKDSVELVSISKSDLDAAINRRAVAFKVLRTLSTRIMGSLRSLGIEDNSVADTREHHRKIHGIRATTSPGPSSEEGNIPTTISASQRGFDNQVKHFREMIDGLSKEEKYNPNEQDLTIESLRNRQKLFEECNTNVKRAQVAYKQALIARDIVLYEPVNGLYHIAVAVKGYVVSLTHARSAEVKDFARIQFKDLSPRDSMMRAAA